MFRLFFLMTLAIFLAASYGTSQNNSSNQVTLQRTKFKAFNFSQIISENLYWQGNFSDAVFLAF